MSQGVSESDAGGVGPGGAGGAPGGGGAGRGDVEAARELASVAREVRAEIGKVVVGQEGVVEQVLVCLLAGGHCLVQGVPGLAKTLLISTLARVTDLSFRRIQFTPDLMPGDITGTEVLQEDAETGRRRLEFVAGPVFANLVLADEINRTPPKTQSALLQAMQEGEVTAGGRTMKLPAPFFVMATQNPIEQEGTYPLPEAQLDRFMMMVRVGYPGRAEEVEVLRRTTSKAEAEVRRVLSAGRVVALQRVVRGVPVGQGVVEFVADLVRATRPDEKEAGDFVRHWLSWGAGPRAGQSLILAGKARALMEGRLHVTVEDVERMACAVLRHRLVLNFNAEAEGVTADQIVEKLLTTVPRGGRRVV